MNRFFAITLCCLFVFTASFSQQWQPLSDSCEITFKIKNFGINVNGSFSGLKGTVIFEEENLAASRFELSVPTNTVNTGINQRDNHLRSADYLDVDKYPEMNFVSTQVTQSTDSNYHFVFGKLTIKEVTKEISFPFKAIKTESGYQFEAEFNLNRRDYNVGGYSISMSDELTVRLKLVVKKEE